MGTSRVGRWPSATKVALLTLAVGLVSGSLLLGGSRALFGQFSVATLPHGTGPNVYYGRKSLTVCLLTTGARNVLDALDLVREERTRTRAERNAFDTFRERVSDIAPAHRPPTTAPTSMAVAVSAMQPDRLQKVRQAYRETVMDVPHYDEEYDDTVAESLAAEFGSDLATRLLASDSFTPLVKRQLMQAAYQRQQDREHFLSTLEREAAALDAARTTIDEIETCLERELPRPQSDCSFDELVAADTHLDAAEKQCEEVLAERQRHRTDGHAAVDAPSTSPPDLQTYLYQSLSVTYPVLADTTDLLDTVRKRRRQITRELATWV